MKNPRNTPLTANALFFRTTRVPEGATAPRGFWRQAFSPRRGRPSWMRQIAALSKECDQLLRQIRS